MAGSAEHERGSRRASASCGRSRTAGARRRPARLSLVAGVLVLSGCGLVGSEHAGSDGMLYDSVEAVTEDSDVVVRVVITEVVGRELDDGGNAGVPGYPGGVPMVILEARVEDDLGADVPGVLHVAHRDAADAGMSEDDVSPLEVGDEVLISGDLLSGSDMPGVTLVDSVLAPTGGEAGVMDVVGDRVVPRDPEIVSLLGPDDRPSAEDEAGEGFGLREVIELAAAANGSAGRQVR